MDLRSDSSTSAVLAFGLGRLARPYVLDNARAYLEYMERAADCTGSPRHLRPGGCTAPARVGTYNALAATMVINFAATLDRADLAETRAHLARLAVALERHRLAHGGYPVSLGDGELAGLLESGGGPLVDPLTGGAFLYERTAGGYTLTSQAWSDAQKNAASWLDAIDDRHDPVLDWNVEQ